MNLTRFCTFAFTVSFLVAAHASTTLHNFSSAAVSKALSVAALRVSPSEKRIANNLAKIYEITEKGYINIALTKKVLKQSRNYSVFRIYKDWLESIVEIHSKKNVTSMRSTCNRLAGLKEPSQIKAELLGKSVVMCFNQYLKLLAKKTKVPLKKQEANLAFFSKWAGLVAHPSNIESLNYFLSRYDRESATWKQYSAALSKHFMSTGKAPSKALLQYMDITPELTRFIQVKGLEEHRSKYVLYNELKKLIKKAYEAANDGKPKKKVASLLKQAVNYYSLSYEHLHQARSDRSMLSLGKSLSRRSYFKEARTAFGAIAEKNPNDENAIFELMWTYLTQEEYKNAFKNVVLRYNLHKNYESIDDDRLQFWTAYTLKQIDHGDSKKVFENLIGKSALNYYSILASKFLSSHYDLPSEKIYYKLANENAKELNKFPKLSKDQLLSVKRFRIWGALDFKPLLILERDNTFRLVSRETANAISNKGEEKAALIMLSAAALKEEENYLESFKLIYKGLGDKLISLDESVLDILFPKPYINQVTNNIKTFDPLIALSLIRQESGFNHKARSWVGARGLMQLMPATAKMYWRGIKTRHLYNPKINIKIGSKYLSMLLNKYENNLVYALSAYNAGESRVKKWRKEYLTHSDSILHNIENIPFPETRKYVKLIFRNLFFYKMMDKKIEIADSEHVNKIFDVHLGFNAD